MSVVLHYCDDNNNVVIGMSLPFMFLLNSILYDYFDDLHIIIKIILAIKLQNLKKHKFKKWPELADLCNFILTWF